jgi:hypothetical protein
MNLRVSDALLHSGRIAPPLIAPKQLIPLAEFVKWTAKVRGGVVETGCAYRAAKAREPCCVDRLPTGRKRARA